MGYYITYYDLQNLSSYEIQSIKIGWEHSKEGKSQIDYLSPYPAVTHHSGSYDYQDVVLENIKPGETREFWFREVNRYTSYKLKEISGVLADGRPFYRRMIWGQSEYGLVCCGGFVLFLAILMIIGFLAQNHII